MKVEAGELGELGMRELEYRDIGARLQARAHGGGADDRLDLVRAREQALDRDGAFDDEAVAIGVGAQVSIRGERIGWIGHVAPERDMSCAEKPARVQTLLCWVMRPACVERLGQLTRSLVVVGCLLGGGCMASNSAPPPEKSSERARQDDEARQDNETEFVEVDFPINVTETGCEIDIRLTEPPAVYRSLRELSRALPGIADKSHEDPFGLGHCDPSTCAEIRGAVLNVGDAPGDLLMAVAAAKSPTGDLRFYGDVYQAMREMDCEAKMVTRRSASLSWSLASFTIVHPRVIGVAGTSGEPCDPLLDDDCMVGCLEGWHAYIDLLLPREPNGSALRISRGYNRPSPHAELAIAEDALIVEDVCGRENIRIRWDRGAWRASIRESSSPQRERGDTDNSKQQDERTPRASAKPCEITWNCPEGEECLGTDGQKACRPATEDECKTWWRCRRDGFCTLIDGRCLLGVDSDEDCKMTYGEGFNPCGEFGMCRALDGDCVE
jgi:hypothetical protein